MPLHHILLALVVATVWGVNFVVMKIGLDYLSPFLLVSLRFTLVFLLMAYWMRMVKGHFWLLCGIGLSLGGVHFALVISGLQLADNITSILVIVQMHVPVTLVMAHFYLKGKIKLLARSRHFNCIRRHPDRHL